MNYYQFQNNICADFWLQSQPWMCPYSYYTFPACDGELASLNTIAGSFGMGEGNFAENNMEYSSKAVSVVYPVSISAEVPLYQVELVKEEHNTIPQEYGMMKSLRKTGLPNIDKNLINILSLINFGREVSFRSCNKSARGLFYGVSRRRSQYIGVLRNRRKWQVLINEGKVKKYIGTYPTEQEAAIVNDLYAIGINGLNARTNFSYSSKLVKAMIMNYFGSKRQFDPSIFISEVEINETL